MNAEELAHNAGLQYLAAAGARAVSPSNTVVVDVVVPPVRTVVAVNERSRRRRERSPSPPSGDDPPSQAAAAEPALKKAKAYESIRMEVRDLLEEKLMGTADDSVKVEALKTLFRRFPPAGATPQDDPQQTDEYCRAVTEWNGCHVVLAALRRELHRAESSGSGAPNVRVVLHVLYFLQRWNSSAERRNAMSRLDGVDAVLRAMRAFRNDANIQCSAILCFGYFTRDKDVSRCREMVEAGSILDIFRAVTAPACKQNTPKFGTLQLGRLCDVAEPHHFESLVERGALEAFAKIAKAHKNSDDKDREIVLAACRKLMSKLI